MTQVSLNLNTIAISSRPAPICLLFGRKWEGHQQPADVVGFSQTTSGLLITDKIYSYG